MNALHIVVAAATVLAVSPAAVAGEGNGDPFPGPNASVVETMPAHPNYAMNPDAPFNYFYTAKPTQMGNRKQSVGNPDDPYPFSASGQVIQTEPGAAASTRYAHSPVPPTHG